MLKLRINYSNLKEKDKLLEAIKEQFKVVKVSKAYDTRESSGKRLYVDVEV